MPPRRAQMEPGFAIWDFKGEPIQEAKVDRFKQLLWRPRPPTLLSREQQRKVRKNLREYARAFDEQDELEAANENSELVERRTRLLDEWNAWRRECVEASERRRKELGREPKKALVKAAEAQEEDEVVEEWVEEVISVRFLSSFCSALSDLSFPRERQPADAPRAPLQETVEVLAE